jgi:MHS family proline/betaine transporter-like MFS transporter
MSSSSDVLKTAVATGIGVILEFYDFLLYGFIVSILAGLFFPSKNVIVSLLLVFGVFAIGFGARPFGGILFGHLGDRIGRKRVLYITIAIMALASLFTGLLPTYSQVGVLAPILLTTLRLVQGLSVGGEYGGGVTLVAEKAPSGKRGLYVSVAQMPNIGPALAVGLVVAARLLLGNAFGTVGWRVLYFLGVGIALIGLYIRTTVTESEMFSKTISERKIVRVPLVSMFRHYWKEVLLGLGFMVSLIMGQYLGSTFAIAYLEDFVKVPFLIIVETLLIGLVVGGLATIYFGYLSDKVGRKPLMLAGVAVLIIYVFPYYYLLSQGTFMSLVIAQILLYTILSIQYSAFVTMLTEMFSTPVRYTGLSFVYQFATAVFGGTAPFAATFIIYVTHYNYAPAYLLFLASVISLVSFALAKETRGRDLGASSV